MYISLAVLGIIILGALVCSKDKDPSINELDSSEHPLKALYPLASRIYGVFVRYNRQELFGGMDVLREIYVDEKPEISLKKQGCKCIASVIMVLAATSFICFAYAYSKESILISGNSIKRTPAGDGTKKYNIILNSEVAEPKPVEIKVSERKLYGTELEKLKSDAGYYLDKKVIGTNKSAECVRDKLMLITEIPGTAVTVKWDEEDSWIVATDGSLKNEDFLDPIPVTLHAELTYYEETWDHMISIVVYPPVVTEEDIFMENLGEALEEIDKDTQTQEFFELPASVDNVELGWTEEEDNTVRNFFIMGLFAAGIIIPAMKKDVKDKQKKRTEQMMKDYPDIISKFIMLITAGMTCRSAWDKICRDYLRTLERLDEKSEARETRNKKTGKKKKSLRYAYEEMLISNNEMQLGIPEIKVYERFGARCSVASYNRFGNMLARNIKRGSAGIIEILESEAKESFAERRESVRKKGEETGTKLLIPMFGMLILVIAIVVVPAFTSFSL